ARSGNVHHRARLTERNNLDQQEFNWREMKRRVNMWMDSAGACLSTVRGRREASSQHPEEFSVRPAARRGGRALQRMTSQNVSRVLLKTLLPFSFLCAAAAWAAPPYAYVTNNNGVPAENSISVFDWTTASLVTTIPISPGPTGIAITPNGAFVYVVSSSGTVSVLAISTNNKVATIPVVLANGFLSAYRLAISPDGAFVYLAAGNLIVISTATNTVVATVPVTNAFSVAITPDGRFAYVTQYGSNSLAVVATATNTVQATVPIPGPGTAWAVAITPDGATAYVTNPGSSTISVVATANNTLLATIQAGINPLGLAITPNGASIYVANAGGGVVTVISTLTKTVSNTISVGGIGRAVAIAPDGTVAYVPRTTPPSGGVGIINTATNTVLGTSPAGQFGDAVAFVPMRPPSLPNTPMQLIVKSTGMCLDVQHYSYDPVTPTIQYWCEGGLNQRW